MYTFIILTMCVLNLKGYAVNDNLNEKSVQSCGSLDDLFNNELVKNRINVFDHDYKQILTVIALDNII